MTWKGFLVVIVPLFAGWAYVDRQSTERAAEELNVKIESRVSRSEFSQHVAQQNRWQDRMESKLDGLTREAVNQTNDINQAQYLFVRLPASESELKDARVRDIIRGTLRGAVNATP